MSPEPLSEEELIAQIEADLNAGEQAYLAGGADPGSETSRANLERYFTGEALEAALDIYASLALNGLQVRLHADVPAFIRVRSIEVLADDEVVVEFCRIDSGVVISFLPSGEEAVFNDEIVRYDNRVVVRRTNGIWVNTGGGDRLKREVGVTSCD